MGSEKSRHCKAITCTVEACGLLYTAPGKERCVANGERPITACHYFYNDIDRRDRLVHDRADPAALCRTFRGLRVGYRSVDERVSHRAIRLCPDPRKAVGQ